MNPAPKCRGGIPRVTEIWTGLCKGIVRARGRLSTTGQPRGRNDPEGVGPSEVGEFVIGCHWSPESRGRACGRPRDDQEPRRFDRDNRSVHTGYTDFVVKRLDRLAAQGGWAFGGKAAIMESAALSRFAERSSWYILLPQ